MAPETEDASDPAREEQYAIRVVRAIRASLECIRHHVAIDPFADLSGLRDRGLQFDYPPIEGLAAELLLVTHEHADHNGVDAVGGDPVILRSTAGRLASPIGEITAGRKPHARRSTPAAPQPTAISDTWVSRMWLPDGSRNDESIP
jgi:hypothetical protein